MTGNRSKGACIWLALAAISFASFARVQSGVEQARAYADPVIKFFAAGPQTDSDASAKAQRAASPQLAVGFNLGLNLLPIFFVGLVAPLVLETFRTCHFQHCAAARPYSSTLFQRPPPGFLV